MHPGNQLPSHHGARTLYDDHHHTLRVRLDARRPPPAHYYAGNLLLVIDTVLARYGDMLNGAERGFGMRIGSLSADGQRLLARLIGRKGPLVRVDSLGYVEVDDLGAALDELAAAGLIDRCPAAPVDAVLKLLRRSEMAQLFAPELRGRRGRKGDWMARIAATNPPCICRWRVRHRVPWVALREPQLLDLYRLLFFGDRRQDLTTFVMRDLGVHRYESVELSRETRLFADRAVLDRFLELAEVGDRIAELGQQPDPAGGGQVTELLTELGEPMDNRILERRRSRALNRLGRTLERAHDFESALSCYARSTLPPARERRMRILHRLGDRRGMEALCAAMLADPHKI